MWDLLQSNHGDLPTHRTHAQVHWCSDNGNSQVFSILTLLVQLHGGIFTNGKW